MFCRAIPREQPVLYSDRQHAVRKKFRLTWPLIRQKLYLFWSRGWLIKVCDFIEIDVPWLKFASYEYFVIDYV